MIKGILFDKDGTLIDFEGTYAPSTIEVIQNLANSDQILMSTLAQAVSLNLESQKFDPTSVVIAGTGRDIAETWHPFLPDRKIDKLTDEVDALYTDITEKHVAAFEDLDRSIIQLKAMNVALGVATNDAEASARRHIAKIDHTENFPFIVGYDSGHGPKPGPGMVIAFADAIDLKPAEIMMVGDSTHDLQAARAAGAISVAVTTGMAGKIDLEPYADYVVENLTALVALVKSVK